MHQRLHRALPRPPARPAAPIYAHLEHVSERVLLLLRRRAKVDRARHVRGARLVLRPTVAEVDTLGIHRVARVRH